MNSLGRRDFLGLLATTVLPLAGVRRRTFAHPAKSRLLITVIGDDTRSAIALGAAMGVDEAQHAAALFGGDVATRVIAEPRLVSAIEDGVQVLIDVREPGRGTDLGATAAATGCVFMNALDASDELRSACLRHVVHIAPAEAMRRAIGAADGESVVGWHSTLTRFGADTLNKRYRARTGAAMDERAWAGWFAVKCAWEATLRSKASNAEDLLAFIERDSTRFDGHKGSGLYFDRRHQLVQPLYIVRGGVVTGDGIPERSDARAPCTWA